MSGVTHFYFMEIDAKWNLGVRPFGMLPFVLAPVVLLMHNGYIWYELLFMSSWSIVKLYNFKKFEF